MTLIDEAFHILERALRRSEPYIRRELEGEHVYGIPHFIAVEELEVNGERPEGSIDVGSLDIYINLGKLARLLERGFTRAFVEYEALHTIFHELFHYKILWRMSPEERRRYFERYESESEYRMRIEVEAEAYASYWASTVARETGLIVPELIR